MIALQRIGLALLLCLSVMCVSCMPGQRLLTVQIEVGGQVAFEGIRGVPDTTPIAQMWDVLSDIHFQPSTTESIAPADNTATHTLEGPVVVRILHTDDQLASATLKKLTLRPNNAADAWTLGEAEVQQIKTAARE